MSAMHSSQIETLLSEAKLSSMSQIIAFISDNVSQVSIGRITKLQERVLELENPKGMDRIMIEEVKTLVEAMLDQKQELFRQEFQRKHRETICSNSDINELQSRRSLQEIDVPNLMNTQLPFHSQQMKKPSLFQHEPQTLFQSKSDLEVQLGEIQSELLLKSSKRQLLELKKTISSLSKEVVSKVTFDEAEKLILKFQKQIFMKLRQNKLSEDELESKIAQGIENSIRQMREQIQMLSKSRVATEKLGKKVKKYLQDMAYLRSDMQSMNCKLERQSEECNDKCRTSIDNIESIETLLQQIAQDKQHSPTHQPKTALVLAKPLLTKNNLATWDRELINSEPNNIEFEPGKTSLRLISSGLYEISCFIFGGRSNQKHPLLLVNSEVVGRFEGRNHQGEAACRWVFREWLQLFQNKSIISVRYQGQQQAAAFLKIERISY